MSNNCIYVSVFRAVRSQFTCAEKEFVIHVSSLTIAAILMLSDGVCIDKVGTSLSRIH